MDDMKISTGEGTGLRVSTGVAQTLFRDPYPIKLEAERITTLEDVRGVLVALAFCMDDAAAVRFKDAGVEHLLRDAREEEG